MFQMLPATIGSSWEAIWEVREVRAVILIAGVLATIAVLIYAVFAIRDLLIRNSDDRLDPSEDLETFRELSRSGAIDGEEYQRVRGALAKRLRDSAKPPQALTMTETPPGSVRQTLSTEPDKRDSIV